MSTLKKRMQNLRIHHFICVRWSITVAMFISSLHSNFVNNFADLLLKAEPLFFAWLILFKYSVPKRNGNVYLRSDSIEFQWTALCSFWWSICIGIENLTKKCGDEVIEQSQLIGDIEHYLKDTQKLNESNVWFRKLSFIERIYSKIQNDK